MACAAVDPASLNAEVRRAEYVAVGGVLGSMFPLLHPVLVREAALRPRRTQMSRGLAAHWDKR